MNSKSSNSKVEKQKPKKDNTFSTFSLNEIFSSDSHQRYRKYMHLPNRKILSMKMNRKIGELRTILIS